MIKEIQAKTLLASCGQPDTWFGLKYNMNLYRGCQHQCIYCDSRSTCYQIENFADILIKANAIELLDKELSRKRIKGTIGTGSMNDPYMPLEKQVQLTRRALQVIAKYRFPVHILTKSDLVLRDVDILTEINHVFGMVSFSIATVDDDLARKLEPGASLPSERFRAIRVLANHGIRTGVIMMPLLPWLEDNEENISDIVEQAKANGAMHIVPSFGLTFREGSRDWFYVQLDRHFPGLRARYEKRFGNSYVCPSPKAKELGALFQKLCDAKGIPTHITPYQVTPARQLAFDLR